MKRGITQGGNASFNMPRIAQTTQFGDKSFMKSMHLGDEMERASSKLSDDNKSVKSKKSIYMHKKGSIATSMKGDTHGKSRKAHSKKEKPAQAEKLNIPERKVHDDTLDESHFQEARKYLSKIQR